MRPDDYIDGFGPCFAVLGLLFLMGKGIRNTLRQAAIDRQAIRESAARTVAAQSGEDETPRISHNEGTSVRDWARR